jgi:hypothetical protein
MEEAPEGLSSNSSAANPLFNEAQRMYIKKIQQCSLLLTILCLFPRNLAADLSSIPRAGYPHPAKAIGALTAGSDFVYSVGANIQYKAQDQFAFEQNTGSITPWNPMCLGGIVDIQAFSNLVYLSGSLSTFDQGPGELNPVRRSRVASVDAATGKVTDWAPNVFGTTIEGWPFLVQSSAIHEGTLFAGGEFQQVNDIGRANLAAVNLGTGETTPWKADVTGPYHAQVTLKKLLVHDDLLIVGGDFVNVAGASRTNLAILDTKTAELKPFNIAVFKPKIGQNSYQGAITNLGVWQNVLYLAGDFTEVGGLPRTNLAAIDLITQQVTEWNPAPSGFIRTFAFTDNAIYVGGNFTSIGGTNRTNLAALSYTTGAALDWNPGPNDTVNTMVYADGKLFVGGNFTQVGTNAMPYLAVFAEKGASWFGGTYVTNGVIHARLFAEEGKTCLIESTTNFAQWTEIKRTQPTNGSFEFTDPVATTEKYYRARALP